MPDALQISHVESVSDAENLANFLNSIWQSAEDVIPFDLILAMIHVGGYATIGKLNSQIVAGSLGFQGEFDSKRVLHSHVTASNSPGAGFALKQHQYQWAKKNSLSAITWTFDPLVRRNCVFNFEKLGASAVEYLPNFYGSMNDAININDESDRLFAYWSLDQVNRTALNQTESTLALRNVSGMPSIEQHDESGSFWVQLPEDIESLRKADANAAREWRLAVREVLAQKLNKGWVIKTMSADRTAILVEPK